MASMIFGGISGSSVSDTASVGAVLIPEMTKKGYTPEYASGITVASSTMGMIIPPSVPVVIYALAAEESVGRLFLGSAIPGLLIGFIMLGITLFVSYRKKHPREEVVLTRKEKGTCIRRAILALIMPVFVIGSVVLGVATATESAGIGVLYAFILGLIVFRTLTLKETFPLLKQAIATSAQVMIIIALSKLYIWILAIERVPEAMAAG
jgi:tripartite ATP-independent transporter DctM subunit